MIRILYPEPALILSNENEKHIVISDLHIGFEERFNKQGISFGIGYRIFGQSGWYWGCSLYLGKYYFGSERNSDSFIRIELLKFGKTF